MMRITVCWAVQGLRDNVRISKVIVFGVRSVMGHRSVDLSFMLAHHIKSVSHDKERLAMLDKPRSLTFPRDINKPTAFAFRFDELVSP